MSHEFYKMNRKVLNFDLEKDLQKIIFNHYIMRKDNLNSMNGDLPKGQFFLTVRTVAKDLDMSIGSVHRMIKNFEEMQILQLIQNGKHSKTPSIYQYNSNINTKKTPIQPSHETNFGTLSGTHLGTSKIEDINNKNLELWISEYGI